MLYREPSGLTLPYPMPKEAPDMDMEGVTLEKQEQRVINCGCADFHMRDTGAPLTSAEYDGHLFMKICRNCVFWHNNGGLTEKCCVM